MDDSVTEAQLHVELGKCHDKVQKEIKDWLEAHERMEFTKHDQIDTSLKQLHTDVALLLKYFEQGRGMVTFIRWLAYAGAAGWAVLVWAKDHLKW